VTNKVYGMIGLATRAGKVIAGDEQCHKLIRLGRKALIIVAEDASENTKSKFLNACEHYGVNIKFYGTKEQLGKTIGKENRASIAVLDKNFADRILELIDEQ
jgi:ribosomal protein L7Ae-like RNA K-turn-binding protein